ncbi:hypothetical protein CJ030_MR7G027931 [Morella rubra]|uniref:Uncharacterized protein n=1 Tax=Morella rubra TaxID=262757 RepID=A0A6A1UZM6_9ROSI|nr:hypothetical protein CJ030_MR7G027931 [Morella rubra]
MSTPGKLAVSVPSLRDCNELLSLTTTSPLGTQTMSGIKHGRGSTCGIALLMAHTGGKLIVYISNGRTGDDDKASSILSSDIEQALEHPSLEMNKEEWTRVCNFFASEEFQRRSAINKENRATLKIVHTSGARLEEARLEIEEMRARQWNMNAFGQAVINGADDARALVDDGGAATEERRRALEHDVGTTTESSKTTRTEDATNGTTDV